ncbi:MAG: GNAT family N-acetyltransferase [Chloroflexi bacterium]|nr:GNAT family N-acetyltransferase [Chloroflexota bacterium]
MAFRIVEQSVDTLRNYGEVPIAFTVASQYRIAAIDGGKGGWRLTEERVERPYTKDYDAGGERPSRWAQKWDLANWVILAAIGDGMRLGGAVVAWNTPGVNMLEGHDDLAVLWDLRVHPAHRRKGIGAQLFRHAAAWARSRGCRQLKVETQNINVPACQFYARQGCYLGAVHYGAYPEYPDEAQLLWYLDL